MASTTMKRIASELGVSITTVSKVLNKHDDISPATRARVMAKVEELGYRPNAVARSLTLRRTQTLGVVIYNLDDSGSSDLASALSVLVVVMVVVMMLLLELLAKRLPKGVVPWRS